MIESKIDLLIRKKAEGQMSTQLYKPREASKNNKNLYRYTEEQLEWIKTECAALFDFFEYNVAETSFFEDIPVSEEPKFSQLN